MLAALVVAAQFMLASVSIAEEQVRQYDFNIDERTLGAALDALARQAGVLVLYPYVLAGSTGVKPVHGRHTIREAYETLLRGTNFSGGLTQSGVLTISALNEQRNGGKSMSPGNKVATSVFDFIARAFAAPHGPAQDNEKGKVFEEVIVTANKREESLSKVGLTIKAIGTDELRQQRLASLQDLAAAVPGLSFTQTEAATPVYTLRGIGFYDTSLAAFPAVSVYMDQAPLPFPVETKLALFDLERVEVLKGPQGTLFGNNATGGAINYIAAKPTSDPHAGLELSYGRFNTFDANGYLSGPLAKSLTGRAAFTVTSGDGWQQSATRPGDKNGAPESYAGRVLLDWKPTDKLRVQTNFNGWLDKSEPTAAQFVQFIPSFNDYIPNSLPKPFIPNENGNPRAADWTPQYQPFADNRLLQATVRADYDLTNAIVLTSITSYTDYKMHQRPEGDGLAESRNDIYMDDGRIRNMFQELRLANNQDPTLRWTVGANFERDAVQENNEIDYHDGTSHYTPSLPAHLGSTTPGGWGYAGGNSYQTQTTYAGFGNGEYTLNQVTLKAGVRYTESHRYSRNCSYTPVEDGNPSPNLSFFSEFTSFLSGQSVFLTNGDCITLSNQTFLPHAVFGRLNEHNLSWQTGIDWKPTETLLIYGNTAKGYKTGSFPNITAATDTCLTPVKQESVFTYELGVKAQLFDRRVLINASVFNSDYNDKQIKSKLLDPVFQYLLALVNVPKSRIQGAELEIATRPITGLTVGGSLVFLDTKLIDTHGPDGNFLVSNANVQANFAGNPIPYAPKWTLTANVNYAFPVTNNAEAFVGAQALYRTKTTSSIGNEPVEQIPGYTTLDLQAGVNFRDGRYRVMLWGKNVTNSIIITNRNFSYDGVAQYVGMPLTYGVTLSAKF